LRPNIPGRQLSALLGELVDVVPHEALDLLAPRIALAEAVPL